MSVRSFLINKAKEISAENLEIANRLDALTDEFVDIRSAMLNKLGVNPARPTNINYEGWDRSKLLEEADRVNKEIDDCLRAIRWPARQIKVINYLLRLIP